MSRTTTALKRLGVPVIAAVTMIAGVPALVGTASADHVNGVTLTAGTSAPAGTCQSFTTTYTSSNAATPTATIDVNLTPSGGDASTVSFCNITPDATGQALPTGNGTGVVGNTRNAEFNDNDGSITFGVLSTVEQTVQVTAFAELNDSGARPGSPGAGVVNTGEPNATSTATFTAGGAAAVTVVDAEPETGFAVTGQSYTATATVRNAAGQPVPGVAVFLDVISGPDAAVINADRCASPTAVTDQRGQVACTFQGNNGPGTDTLRIYVNKSNGSPETDTTAFDSNDVFDDVTVAFQAPQANTTTITLTCGTNPTNAGSTNCQLPTSRTSQQLTATVRNAAGAPLAGVAVTFSLTVGGTADPAGTNDTETLSQTQGLTDANGQLTVTATDTVPTNGETLTVRATIQRGDGPATATSVTTFRNAVATDARTITLSPAATATVGSVQPVRATVLDRFGNPVPGVQVTFTEDGTGRFVSGSSTFVGFTGSNGQVVAELTTTSSEQPGSNTITAVITGFDLNGDNDINDNGEGTRTATGTNDECEQAAGASGGTAGSSPGAPAGDCDAQTTVNFVAATAPPTTTPPTTTPPTTTPPTQGPDCTKTPTVVLERSTIIATGRTGYRVTGGPANADVQIFAYSRPSNTYVKVRDVALGADGNGPGGDGFTPPTNTRLYAQVVGCDTDETRFSVVINVRTQISLNVVRNGPRNYTFSGRLLPARPGGLIASLYRVTNDGRQILTAQTRANASNGAYTINRRFTGTGRFGFVVRTGQDLQNAPGSSNVRSLLVF